MLGHRSRVPLALGAAAIAAGGATLILRPRGSAMTPAAASAGDYFTSEQLRRARAWARPRRLQFVASTVVETGILALLIVRPARLARARRGGSAASAAALSLGMTVVGLPFAVVSERRARRFGLSTQSWGPWLGDLVKSTAIGTPIAAAGGAVADALIRRFPQTWWLPASGALVGFSALTAFLAPVVIDPLFNRFEPLPEGDLRSEVLELARRADVDVGDVYRVDASRRTTATNAYVWGLGRTKRVVIYDTLIDGYPDDQVRSVVAHELSHVVHRDVLRGLAWLAIVAPAGVFLVKELVDALDPDRAARVPALALSGGLVSAALSPLSNGLSRAVERGADRFALDLTGDAGAFIELARSLAVTNLADPSTPRVWQLAFGTHPSTLERIGAALQWSSAQASTAGQGP